VVSHMAFCSGPFWPDEASIRRAGCDALLAHTAGVLAEGARGEGADPALVEALLQVRDAPAHVRPTWAPSIGAGMAVRSDLSGRSAAGAAVQVLLDFVEAAEDVKCRVELVAPTRLRADPVVLPPTMIVAVDWRPPRLTLDTGSIAVELAIDGGDRRLTDVCGPTADVTWIEPAGDLRLVHDCLGGCFPPLDDGGDRPGAGPLAAELTEAGRCLEASGTGYASWVAAMVRYVVPVTRPPGGYVSGSTSEVPGVITLSPGAGAIRIAESLVHEAAHQYFYFASRFGAMVDADAGATYYSPLKRTNRSLDNILLAYHAVANMVAFYELLRNSTVWRPELDGTLAATRADCEVLDGHLHGNPHLQEAGQIVYQPIRGWLADRGLLRG
jgi:HEXXH motif-containing protein